MKKSLFIAILMLLFLIPCSAQEYDILDFAAKHPSGWQVKNPDGTPRTLKYGDNELDEAAGYLKDYPQPFTVPKVISWYGETENTKTRANLLRVLAASRDSRAAVVLGNSLNAPELEVRWSATYGLMDYFIFVYISGGTEGHMVAAQQWWKENEGKLKKQADCITLNITPKISLETVQKNCLKAVLF